jgi:hypothetical protein
MKLHEYTIKNIKLTTHGASRAIERFGIDKSPMLAEIEIKNKILNALKHNKHFKNGTKLFLDSQLKDKNRKELEFVLEMKGDELLLVTLKPSSMSSKLTSIE